MLQNMTYHVYQNDNVSLNNKNICLNIIYVIVIILKKNNL